jgi:fatty acid desaturase
MDLVAEIVNWGELGKTVVAAFIAGVGISSAFALGILGAAQFAERRRQGEVVAAAGAAVLAAAGLAICAAGIVFGMIVMLGD